jgi:hypothetical protein
MAMLAKLAPAFRPGGRLGIEELDRPTRAHGTPPKLLVCELAAAGYRLIELKPLSRRHRLLRRFLCALGCHAGSSERGEKMPRLRCARSGRDSAPETGPSQRCRGLAAGAVSTGGSYSRLTRPRIQT